jgi:hypothetical protein
MWRDNYTDWIILGSGYVLSLALFRWLGGVAKAGEAIRRWAGWFASDHGHRPAS